MEYRNFVYLKWFRVLFLILAIALLIFECWDIFSWDPSGWQKQFAVMNFSWCVYLITHGIFSLIDKNFMNVYTFAAMFVIFVIDFLITIVACFVLGSILWPLIIFNVILFIAQVVIYDESTDKDCITKGS